MLELKLIVILQIFSIIDTVPLIEPKEEVDIFADDLTSFRNNSGGVKSGKVLNFFPVPVEEECLATDGRRKGICMNTYECKIQTGTSYGPCALGFGVCCVFKVTCHQDVFNNITYFVNPHFPDLTQQISSCPLKIKKIEPEISQIRLDFIHFTLGQPNRKTGDCDDDIFEMYIGQQVLKICGINSGQHVYFDVDDSNDAININMTMSKKNIQRIWEIKITQVPFVHRAPPNCLQYFTESTGVVQTMNFAENGRHLANQEYNICVQQQEGMCSIIYEPCYENSFQIGPNTPMNPNNNFNDSNTMLIGSGTVSAGSITETVGKPVVEVNAGAHTNPVASPVSGLTGGVDTSSFGPVVAQSVDETNLEDVGSGDGALPQNSPIVAENRMMEMCVDRILLPCDDDDFLMPMDGTESSSTVFCDLVRCGNSLCPHGEIPCQVESSVTPFIIGVRFGPSAREQSPDENIGMCLTYEQQPCTV